jgi:hypothetical protein
MSVSLPSLPDLAQVSARLVDFQSVLTPILGGPVQTIQRLGARFAVDVTLPPLEPVDAASFLAARMKARAENETLTLAWPQAEVWSVIAGSPVVNGAGQAGARLNISGLTAGQTVPAGRFFSFQAGGRHYLHVTTQAVTANGSGQVQLHVAPLLRASPANGAALNFSAPVVEGLLTGNVEWTLERLRWTSTAFTLAENA